MGTGSGVHGEIMQLESPFPKERINHLHHLKDSNGEKKMDAQKDGSSPHQKNFNFDDLFEREPSPEEGGVGGTGSFIFLNLETAIRLTCQ